MDDTAVVGRADAAEPGRQAEAALRDALTKGGWRIARPAVSRSAGARPDFLVRNPHTTYAVQVKTAAEGRGDRLVALWAQAYLQAARAAGTRYVPLAVVAAPRITSRVAAQVLEFAATYAPDAGAGVIDFAGLRRFRGPGLDVLDTPDRHERPSDRTARGVTSGISGALFSDLNQWLLKVLLAPELPERLLTAPRDAYRNASHLARAAKVSVMSAFRLVQQLERDGHLDAGARHLTLVRRDDLLRRWQSAVALRHPREIPMRYLLGGEPQGELERVVREHRACLALFAAADALGLGFVDGVPPYVYVPRLGSATLGNAKHLVPAERGESPDLVVRQAPAPHSVFRGAVRVRARGSRAHGADDVPACDVLQVWLDVAAHPARGQEQADLIRRRVLTPLLDGSTARENVRG